MIKIVMKNKKNRSFIFGDFDKDGIKNIDDKYPFNKKKKGQIEETSLARELKIIKKYAHKFVLDTKIIAKDIKRKGYTVKYRVKGTFSIVNKIRRKSLKEIRDIGGILILVNNKEEAFKAGEFVERNYNVIEKDDYFTEPKDEFYRALHYTVMVNKLPFEIQIKTKKEFAIHLKAHKKYKSRSEERRVGKECRFRWSPYP